MRAPNHSTVAYPFSLLFASSPLSLGVDINWMHAPLPMSEPRFYRYVIAVHVGNRHRRRPAARDMGLVPLRITGCPGRTRTGARDLAAGCMVPGYSVQRTGYTAQRSARCRSYPVALSHTLCSRMRYVPMAPPRRR